MGGSGGEKNIITAMIRRENESLRSTYQVIPAGGTYAWVDTGSTYASPPSKNGYEAVRIAEIPFIDDIVDSIIKKKNENRALKNKINIPYGNTDFIFYYFDLLKFFFILISSPKNLQSVKFPINLEVILSE